jgi:chromosome segregation ATPase
VQQVAEAIQYLQQRNASLTCQAVAIRAGVSRTFLYENPRARALFTTASTSHSHRHRHDQADHDAQQDTSWRERALNAEQALKAAHAEIHTQRGRISQLLGQIRDIEHDVTEATIQRTTTENTTLKQRVRQLTHENRTLEERLHAARSNSRFLDKQIADLEAQLLDAADALGTGPT